MSDGGNDATRGRRRAIGSAADDESIAPNPQPKQGAAPWERFPEPPSEVGPHQWFVEPPVEPVEPVEPEDTEKVGSHTEGGVSVADLIARIGATSADRA